MHSQYPENCRGSPQAKIGFEVWNEWQCPNSLATADYRTGLLKHHDRGVPYRTLRESLIQQSHQCTKQLDYVALRSMLSTWMPNV